MQTNNKWKRIFSTLNPPDKLKALQSANIKQRDMIDFLQKNFTVTVENLRQERGRALRDRDLYLEEAVKLRRESSLLKEQLTAYTRCSVSVLTTRAAGWGVNIPLIAALSFIVLIRKCKEDFANSLNGIQAVTEKFLDKINNVFPHQQTFYLTCAGQSEQLEKIKNSCTNLSRDIENKFQLYLDNVGNKVRG